MASELNLGSIDATPYKDFSGGIEDDYEPCPIGEFMARGIVAERGRDGTRVATRAHRIARGRINSITGYDGRFSHMREDDDTHLPNTFLEEMVRSLEPQHDTTCCTRCGFPIIWDFVEDFGYHAPKHEYRVLCARCRKEIEQDKQLQLEPEVEKKTPKMISSFLTLGNILENRPLPQSHVSFDEFDTSSYIASNRVEEINAAIHQYYRVENVDYLDLQTTYAQLRDWMIISSSSTTAATENGDYWYSVSSYSSPHTTTRVSITMDDDTSSFIDTNSTSYFVLPPPNFMSNLIESEIVGDDVNQITDI